VYWKYGVWVYEKSTGCRALLEQQMDDARRGRITLRVQGRRHEDLARWLQARIQERNGLFGYHDLPPVVDDFGLALRRQEHGDVPSAGIAGHRRSGPTPLAAQDHSGAVEAVPPPTEPIFDKLPEALFPPREPQVFVSYAWGDDTSAGRQRAQVVDDLCVMLGRQGVHVRRDRDEMRPGDLISEFMDRLASGDFVLAVISDKYLRSEYCMYELFRIYRNCADKPDRFLGKVVPLILPDARLDSLANRFERARYWTQQEKELKPLIGDNIDTVGTEFFRKFKLIGEFARNTSNMLEYLVDKLQPRDFERQAEGGFTEVLSQIGQTR
jgi:internalin A